MTRNFNNGDVDDILLLRSDGCEAAGTRFLL